jgi:hypothetical protein
VQDHHRATPCLTEEESEERFFLPLPKSSLSSSSFALASLAAGTLPALLPPPPLFAMSRSFWLLMTTFGLDWLGLSAPMLSRSSLTLSVSFRDLPWRSRPLLLWPTLVAREADEGGAGVSALRSAERTSSWLQMSLPEESEVLIRERSSLVSLMFSRRAASSSESMRSEGSSPRSGRIRYG